MGTNIVRARGGSWEKGNGQRALPQLWSYWQLEDAGRRVNQFSFRLHVGILSGLSLCKTCAHCHNCYEFIHTTALSRLGNTKSQEVTTRKTVFPGSVFFFFFCNWSRCNTSSASHTAIEEHRFSELGSSCCSQTHFSFLINKFSYFADKTTEGTRDSAIRPLTVPGPRQCLPLERFGRFILLVWSTLTLPAPLSSE